MTITRSFPFSTMFLALAGIIITGLGLYFVFLRPPLLPEDLRYMGARRYLTFSSICPACCCGCAESCG